MVVGPLKTSVQLCGRFCRPHMIGSFPGEDGGTTQRKKRGPKQVMGSWGLQDIGAEGTDSRRRTQDRQRDLDERLEKLLVSRGGSVPGAHPRALSGGRAVAFSEVGARTGDLFISLQCGVILCAPSYTGTGIDLGGGSCSEPFCQGFSIFNIYWSQASWRIC